MAAFSFFTPLCLAGAYSEYAQTDLVSDIPGMAQTTDPNLVNPWGVSFALTSPFWVSNQGSGTVTLYTGTGSTIPLVVSIPAGTPPATGPTGQVFNGTAAFVIPSSNPKINKPATFIFDTLNGDIDAWNFGTGGSAVTVASTPGAVYTGLALAGSGSSIHLYAADSTGSVRVFNSSFQQLTMSGSFTDPNGIKGFVPFNIQQFGSNLFVTYASLTPMGTANPGGYIDIYSLNGTFVGRFATGGPLDGPWALSMAPAGFGIYGNDLLVGNFGNGEILAYNMAGDFLGVLDGENGKPLVNDFLWSLNFRSAPAFNPDALYFTAGIDNQTKGLFGEITPAPEPASVALLLLGGVVGGLSLRRRSKRV